MIRSADKLTPEEAAALLQFDLMDSHLTEKLAEHWLEQDYDAPSIIELAFPQDLNLVERRALMVPSLKAVGVDPLPGPEESLWLLNRQLISRLAADNDDYMAVLAELVALDLHTQNGPHLPFGDDMKTHLGTTGQHIEANRSWAGQHSGISVLYGLRYAHDDVQSGWTDAHETKRRSEVVKDAGRTLVAFYTQDKRPRSV